MNYYSCNCPVSRKVHTCQYWNNKQCYCQPQVYDTNLHMIHHYKRVNSAKSVVNTSPPKCFQLRCKNVPQFRSRFSTSTLLSNPKRIPSRTNSNLEVQKKNVKNEVQKTERSSSVPPRPCTRRNLSAMPQNYLKTGNNYPKLNKENADKIPLKIDYPMSSHKNSPNRSCRINKCEKLENSQSYSNKAPIPAPRYLVTSPTAVEVVPDYEYLQFSLRITEDIIRNDLYGRNEMRRVFNSHIEANRGRLNMKKMLLQIDHLCRELNVNKRKNAQTNTYYCEHSKLGETSKKVSEGPSSKDNLVKKILDSNYVMTDEEIHELTENELQDVITGLLNEDDYCTTCKSKCSNIENRQRKVPTVHCKCEELTSENVYSKDCVKQKKLDPKILSSNKSNDKCGKVATWPVHESENVKIIYNQVDNFVTCDEILCTDSSDSLIYLKDEVEEENKEEDEELVVGDKVFEETPKYTESQEEVGNIFKNTASSSVGDTPSIIENEKKIESNENVISFVNYEACKALLDAEDINEQLTNFDDRQIEEEIEEVGKDNYCSITNCPEKEEDEQEVLDFTEKKNTLEGKPEVYDMQSKMNCVEECAKEIFPIQKKCKIFTQPDEKQEICNPTCLGAKETKDKEIYSDIVEYSPCSNRLMPLKNQDQEVADEHNESNVDYVTKLEEMINGTTKDLYEYSIPEKKISQSSSPGSESDTDKFPSEGQILTDSSSKCYFTRRNKIKKREEPEILEHLKKYEQNRKCNLNCLYGYRSSGLIETNYKKYVPKFQRDMFYPTVSTQTSNTGFQDNLLSDGEVKNTSSESEG